MDIVVIDMYKNEFVLVKPLTQVIKEINVGAPRVENPRALSDFRSRWPQGLKEGQYLPCCTCCFYFPLFGFISGKHLT